MGPVWAADGARLWGSGAQTPSRQRLWHGRLHGQREHALHTVQIRPARLQQPTEPLLDKMQVEKAIANPAQVAWRALVDAVAGH